MEKSESNYKHIKGWGVDADPDNEPTYPIKKYTGDDHKRLNYSRPPQQETEVDILHSNERPGLTAVFGISSPPVGLSGVIRRYAFKQSESSYGHWLPLLLADRINMVEGIVGDLIRGHIPNIFKERGWKSEWKFNRKKAVGKILIRAAAASVIAVLIFRKKKVNKLYTSIKRKLV